MKPSLLFLICAITFGAIGCSNAPEGANANFAKPEKEVQKEDGSVVAVSSSPNGIRAEARTFPAGDIARVTRITSPNGRRRALAEFRDGRSVEIRDENEVDRVIEASAETVRAATIKAWDAKNAAGPEAADKSADAANRAADAGKDAGKAASDAANRGAEEVRNTGKVVKKAGEKLKDSVTP
jgi:hypothetical protein